MTAYNDRGVDSYRQTFIGRHSLRLVDVPGEFTLTGALDTGHSKIEVYGYNSIV